MSKHDDGGPAFPQGENMAAHEIATAAIMDIPRENVVERDKTYMKMKAEVMRGMSLRDYFAGQALVALMQSGYVATIVRRITTDTPEAQASASKTAAIVSRICYRQADAMLAERAKRKGASDED